MDNHEGPYKTTDKRDVKQSKSGEFPTFQIRIAPELKVQFKVAAKEAGMSLGNWLKTPERKELDRPVELTAQSCLLT
ncbi:toxin-antitoxin system HicB family antitoxin [uncultured Cedecea sp.]|uniref:toxin-antitoxin system HicB family antitoxin n=1 Tax=uncultured Cedecea sp. TaxID=988762 RepID=UPI002638B44D|nr:toxin-antitoxin system HicB family antitoxin [uncultured Cedecea sp.]